MAAHAWNSEDLSALWGAPEDSGLQPVRPDAPLIGAPSDPEDLGTGDAIRSNGGSDRSHLTVVDQDVREGVARLAQAIAVNQVDVLRKTDLEALHSELEATFTHQLAVALYEVLAASNVRFAAAEDRVAQRITEALEAQGGRLVTAMEEGQLLAMESAEAMQSELAAMRLRLNGPIDALPAFQREVRHEVGRLGDMLTTQATMLAQKAENDAEELASARGQLATAVGEVEGVSGTLGTVKDDLSALREEVARLTQILEGSGRRARRSHWRRRSG